MDSLASYNPLFIAMSTPRSENDFYDSLAGLPVPHIVTVYRVRGARSFSSDDSWPKELAGRQDITARVVPEVKTHHCNDTWEGRWGLMGCRRFSRGRGLRPR